MQNYIIFDLDTIKFLTQFDGSNAQIVCINQKKYFLTDGRYKEYIKKFALHEYEIVIDNIVNFMQTQTIDEIAIDNLISVKLYTQLKQKLNNIKFIPLETEIEFSQVIKNDEQISKLKYVQNATKKVYEKVIRNLKINMTEKEIVQLLIKYGEEHKLTRFSFDPIVAIDKNSSMPHAKPGNNKLTEKSIIQFDFGYIYENYCSDFSRVHFMQENSEYIKVYDVVKKAQSEAIKAIKPNIIASKIDKVARNIIDQSEYKGKFIHSLGHGVGIKIHEEPYLSVTSQTELLPGMVITVEPGIYLENKFGIRIEDVILVTKDGYEIL